MIINDMVVSYFVMMALSLGICIPAALTGWRAANKWKMHKTGKVQDHTEKAAYLVIVFLCLGFSIRLFMIPLWFLTLQSLIPHVPGAMCMTGLHLLDIPISIYATILKFFIPLAYIYWLILNSVDRRIESQPFMTKKLRIVVLLAGLMILESFLDIHFLLSVKPKVVHCCTSIFDASRFGVIKAIRHGTMVWAFLFYSFFALMIVTFIVRFKSEKIMKIISAASSIMAMIFFVLMLHTKVSPLVLETPYHQCIFCLWQNAVDITIASGIVILGLWFNVVYASLPCVKEYPAASDFARKLRRAALIFCLFGTGWITMHLMAIHFIPMS